MKKLFLFLFLVPTVCAQIDFTSSFPKIGFGDFYTMRNNPSSFWLPNQYYYPQQHDLGYNYIWSLADTTSLNLANTYNLKILHYLAPKVDTSHSTDTAIYYYCWSGANDPNWLSYQIGGGIIARIDNTDDDQFGFGQTDQTSWWAAENYWENLVGERNKTDDGNRHVFYADRDRDKNQAGQIMLQGVINNYHTWVGPVDGTAYDYTLELITKCVIPVNLIPSYSHEIAKVKVYEVIDSSLITSCISRTVRRESRLPLADTLTFIITTDMFSGSDYQGIKLEHIKKKNGSISHLKFELTWTGNFSFYIDSYSIYDQYYKNLFLASPSIIAQTKSYLQSNLNLIPGFSSRNANFGHIYIDEPASMYYRSIDKVSSYATESSNYYINGALGNVTDLDARLNIKQRPNIPYVMSDIYPFLQEHPDRQDALDHLILDTYSNGAGLYTKGLRIMANYANNFTGDITSDDRPFIQTIQVMKEDQKHLGDWIVDYYRAPTYNEILVQGWLALCYGAKGLMYYCTYSGGDTNYTKTWGLLEPKSNDPTNWPNYDQGFENNPSNDRYEAVKELNRQVDLVGPELLNLTWIKGYNVHKGELLNDNYISGISSYYIRGYPRRIIFNDLPSESFVEIGKFKKTSDYQNPNLDYFMLVNKRCESNELRHIVTSFDKTGAAYVNWRITDVINNRAWSFNKTGTLDDTLSPGIGRLYKLSPVVMDGGEFIATETISGNITLTRPLTVKAGALLIITGTYHVKADITLDSMATILVGSGGKLIVDPGININFQNGTNFVVLGTLIADASNGAQINFRDTASFGESVLFTFHDVGAAGSILRNVKISNIMGIQCSDNANIEIKGCTFENTGYGLYAYSAQPSFLYNLVDNPFLEGIYIESPYRYPKIIGNIIKRTTDQYSFEGIFLGSYSYPIIMNNQITGFDYGIYVGGGSNASFYEESGFYMNPNNLIKNNNRGICAAWGAFINAGDANKIGGSNSIYGNSEYAAYAYQQGYIQAYYDYWGSSTPAYSFDNTSFIRISNKLFRDPWFTNDPNFAEQSENITNLFMEGLNLEKEGKVDEAVTYYKNLIKNDKFSRLSFNQLAHLGQKYSLTNVNEYFESIVNSHNKHYSKVKKIMADLLLFKKQYDEALKAYDDVINNSSTDYDGINAKFEKLFAYFHIKNDPVAASQILLELKQMDLTEHEHIIRLNMAENLLKSSSNKIGKLNSGLSKEIPHTFELFQNFPNPFNPITTIKYQVQKVSNITLKVFDLLGREVKTLVNEIKPEGYYEIQFDASNLSSGIYVYQLKSDEFISNKKMILIK